MTIGELPPEQPPAQEQVEQQQDSVIKDEQTIQTHMDMDAQSIGVPLVTSSTIYSQMPGTYFVVPKTPAEVIEKLTEEAKSLERVQEALNLQLHILEEEAEALQKTKEEFEAAQGKVLFAHFFCLLFSSHLYLWPRSFTFRIAAIVQQSV